MMRDYAKETEKRVAFIQSILNEAHADGIVYGNSGGKDCTLVGILCKKACENVTSVIMPCSSSRNYGIDREHAILVANQYHIQTLEVDLSGVKDAMVSALDRVCPPSEKASININPRLRMTALYSIAQTKNALVAGTGNLSEKTMGYFTKWGDGAYDFNPIGDLTVTEIYEFLRYLGAPQVIIDKAPSAGLYEGQTDEKEMGIAYASIDRYLLCGEGSPEEIEKIERAKRIAAHKNTLPPVYHSKE